MKIKITFLLAFLIASSGFAQKLTLTGPLENDFANHDGWISLFDGKALNGWDGDRTVWSVQDHAIVGEYKSAAGIRNGQTFLILKDHQPADFELKLEIKLEGAMADSGIQYRSYLAAPRPGSTPAGQDTHWNLGGYQFDFHFNSEWNGQIAEGGPLGRGIIAKPGQIVRTEEGKQPRLIAELGPLETMEHFYHPGEWNQIHLIVHGNELVQIVNGHVMAVLVDDDLSKAKMSGLIGLQCSGLGTVKISFRNFWLKEWHQSDPKAAR